jgi:hypothetical protein
LQKVALCDKKNIIFSEKLLTSLPDMKAVRINYVFILFSSFIEGGALMAVELLSSKIIAPYYGASLYVWATILGVTMGGLALGYYIGGIFSEKKLVSIQGLLLLFLISSFFTFFTPYSAHLIMEQTLNLEIKTAILVSCLVFMLPPIICFGMISPISIRLLIKNKENIGFSTGMVYTISTIGGILFTFLTGFLLISAYGIKFSVILVSIFLLIPPVIYFLMMIFRKKLLKNV